MEDWAEIRRLHRSEGLAIKAIARQLGVARNTVRSALAARRPIRSISVAEPEGEIVHLLTPGSRASLRTGRMHVVKGDEPLGSYPIEKVVGLVVHGNIDLSSGLVREILWRGLTVVWCSGRGRVIGWASSAESPNGQSRVQQHVLSESGSLHLAQEFVYAKLANQATFLRRNGDAETAVLELRRCQRAARAVGSLPELFALEGRGAQLYFSGWHSLLKGALRERGCSRVSASVAGLGSRSPG